MSTRLWDGMGWDAGRERSLSAWLLIPSDEVRESSFRAGLWQYFMRRAHTSHTTRYPPIHVVLVPIFHGGDDLGSLHIRSSIPDILPVVA